MAHERGVQHYLSGQVDVRTRRQVARLLEALLSLRVAGRRYQHAGLKPGPRHLVLVGQVISAEQPPQTVESEVDLPGEQASSGELQLQPRVGERSGQVESGLEMLRRRGRGSGSQGLTPGRGQDGDSFGVTLQMGADGVGRRLSGGGSLCQQGHEGAGVQSLTSGRRHIVVQSLAEQRMDELRGASRDASYETRRAQRFGRFGRLRRRLPRQPAYGLGPEPAPEHAGGACPAQPRRPHPGKAGQEHPLPESIGRTTQYVLPAPPGISHLAQQQWVACTCMARIFDEIFR